jgi:hypothetical protein
VAWSLSLIIKFLVTWSSGVEDSGIICDSVGCMSGVIVVCVKYAFECCPVSVDPVRVG